MSGKKNKKRIVILGGGFSGLQTALTLSRKTKRLPLKSSYEIVLIDKNDYHTFTPLLYETAATSKETADYLELKSLVAYPLEELLKKTNVQFLKDEVFHIDMTEGVVHLKSGKMTYEYLVLALGAETNYFNIPGLQKESISLKSFAEALEIRNSVLDLVEGGVKNPRIVIGGAGANGVELSAEIQNWACKLHEEIGKTCDAQVTLINSSELPLSSFGHKVSKIAARRLKKIGVDVENKERVKELKKKTVILGSGKKISFDLFVWTGGVKATSLTKKLPIRNDSRGRVEVAGPLECIPEGPDLKFAGKVYVAGDIACFYDPKTERPVPQAARPAMVQGKIVAKNIIEDIKKEEGLSKKAKHRTFRPWNYPYIVPIGGKFAVAKFGPIIVSGFLAWILKGLVELNYFLSIMSPGKAIKIWLKGFSIFIQNDRLG